MKKLISLLLAVSVMAISTCASAAFLNASNQRNPGTWGHIDEESGDRVLSAGEANSNSLRDYNSPVQLAVYRPGDTITFSKGDLTVAAGDVVTFISSKVDADDLNSATVMFIDQATTTGTSFTYSYKIRENLAKGVYQLDIKVGDQAVDTFYYGVADPKVTIATIDQAGDEQAKVVGDTAYYFAAVSVDGDFKLEQAGVKAFGFDFNGTVATFDAEVADYAENVSNIDNEGTANWWFTIGITGVDEANLPVAADAIVNE